MKFSATFVCLNKSSDYVHWLYFPRSSKSKTMSVLYETLSKQENKNKMFWWYNAPHLPWNAYFKISYKNYFMCYLIF